jgi:hypothetical protein
MGNPDLRVFLKIFLAVIATIVLALGVHNFIRAHKTSATTACLNNLRLIEAAKQQWALENSKTTNDIPTWDDIRPYLGRFQSNSIPVCPKGGTYTLGRVGNLPTCSVGGPDHSLSQ